MADLPSLGSLLDLVPVYDNLLLYLSCYDIFNLLQVNSYFKEKYSINKCWKRFVHYPLKYILCDLKSNSTAVGVSEVLQDILKQEGKYCWLNYCRLQEAHLRNWANGQNIVYDTISVPLRYMSYMEEIVDDNNEHWVCFSVGETLSIWNITSQPQTLDPINVGRHKLVRLLSSGQVLVKGEEGCILAVYKIIQEKNRIELRHHFRFDEEGPRKPLDFGINAGDLQHSLFFNFIAINNVFIGYMCQMSAPPDYFLHFWDLGGDICRKLYKRSLTEVLQVFEAFLKYNDINMGQLFHLNLIEADFPYTIVVLKYTFNGITFSQVNRFDVSSMNFTHVIAQTRSEVLSCSLFNNKTFLHEKILSQNGFYSRVSVYSVLANNWKTNQAQGRCLYEYNHNELLTENSNSIMLKKSKAFIKTDNKVIVILADPLFHRLEIPMDAGFKFLGFIEPKILLMYDSFRNHLDTEVRVYNILRGTLIHSWDRVNTTPPRLRHYFRNLVFPSKLILNFEGQEDQFRIYKF